MATSDTFKLAFPELCDVGDEVIEFWLAKSVAYLCPDSWGACFEDACLYLTAHRIALSLQRKQSGAGGGNASGAVQSASADGLSVSYALPQYLTQGTIDEANYGKTPYGQEFLQLRSTCIPAGRLAGTVQNTASEPDL